MSLLSLWKTVLSFLYSLLKLLEKLQSIKNGEFADKHFGYGIYSHIINDLFYSTGYFIKDNEVPYLEN